jgi:hypothetical protein
MMAMGAAMPKLVAMRGGSRKEEERFLSAQADAFAGAKREEKASACSARNDCGDVDAEGNGEKSKEAAVEGGATVRGVFLRVRWRVCGRRWFR